MLNVTYTEHFVLSLMPYLLYILQLPIHMFKQICLLLEEDRFV